MLLSNDELKAKLGTEQSAQVLKWLRDRHIRYALDAKKKPITTLSAIERFLFSESEQEVDF